MRAPVEAQTARQREREQAAENRVRDEGAAQHTVAKLKVLPYGASVWEWSTLISMPG